MSVLVGSKASPGSGGGGGAGGLSNPLCNNKPLKAYSDPVIFRDDRVLKTLLRKESKYVAARYDYFTGIQSEIRPHNRKQVADWMLEVCEDQNAQPEVFVLAVNYLDRFLSICNISRSQLQLLGAVCLLVSWKVREHQHLPAMRLVEYSAFNLTLVDIMEWEVLLLSKLDWDMSSVIASDFVEHIIQRVRSLHLGMSPDIVRRHSETLIAMTSSHYDFSALNPSLIASAAVLTTLRPFLEEEESVLASVENITGIPQDVVLEVIERIENLMRASLPASPTTPDAKPKKRPDSPSEKDDYTTPTKVLDVAASQY